MVAPAFLSHILANDALTRGLSDPEARMLVEWLVDHTERLVLRHAGRAQIDRLYRRARAIGRFVSLWSQGRSRGAAQQLAAAERFAWPLPVPGKDPCEVMQEILEHEARLLTT